MDDELLDVFDEHGRHRGVKRRGDVHRDGDWHLAFHLWVVCGDGVLLQRRAADKDSWPGYLDASAAGHLLAGEAVSDGLREVEEELGSAYAFDDLDALGVHRVCDPVRDGRVNRELQHVFAVRDDRPLSRWTAFDRVEVDGLVLVGHDALAALACALGGAGAGGPAAFAALAGALAAGGEGSPASVTVPGRAWDGTRETAITVGAGELMPAPY